MERHAGIRVAGVGIMQAVPRMTEVDPRALSPLVYSHVNPYGLFELNMDERLDLELKMAS